MDFHWIYILHHRYREEVLQDERRPHLRRALSPLFFPHFSIHAQYVHNHGLHQSFHRYLQHVVDISLVILPLKNLLLFLF